MLGREKEVLSLSTFEPFWSIFAHQMSRASFALVLVGVLHKNGVNTFSTKVSNGHHRCSSLPTPPLGANLYSAATSSRQKSYVPQPNTPQYHHQ